MATGVMGAPMVEISGLPAKALEAVRALQSTKLYLQASAGLAV